MILPALAVAAALMLIARPAAVFLCLAPFRFSLREKLFMSWVGLRGAVGIFIASIPLLVGLPNAHALFRRRVRRGAGVAAGAGLDHRAGGALARRIASRAAIRCRAGSSSTCRGSSSRRSSAIRSAPTARICGAVCCRPGRGRRWWCATQKILSPGRGRIRCGQGDYVYLLAPPEKAQALDRFFVDMPPPARPDPRLLGDFFVTGDHTLGELAEIYGLTIAPEETAMSLADYIAERTPADGRARATSCRSGRSRWWCTG